MKLVVPAREGRAVEVARGQRLRLTTPKGAQAADFFAFSARDRGEWLSANHTWVWTRNVKPRQGDTLQSRFRRPMIYFEEDGADGVHDMMIAACDQFRYEQLGHEGPHPNCADNMHTALRRVGHSVDVVPQPINFFTNTRVTQQGGFESPPNTVVPGGYVVLRAEMDLIAVISACPYDLQIADWPINSGAHGPSEIIVEVE
ncbi:urea carboxylase-associated family protein [Aquibaculum sediminis]|uniref:urea carboxylase-associated family protein n=1 Tax=Aquibaculum sediminis TaxID=3231907 RepID=UPI0034535BA4